MTITIVDVRLKPTQSVIQTVADIPLGQAFLACLHGDVAMHLYLKTRSGAVLVESPSVFHACYVPVEDYTPASIKIIVQDLEE